VSATSPSLLHSGPSSDAPLPRLLPPSGGGGGGRAGGSGASRAPMALPLPPTLISNGAFETTKENAECERAGCESSSSLLLLRGEVVSRDGRGVRQRDDGGGRGNDDVVIRHDAREEGDVIDDDRRERAGLGDVVVPDALLEGPGGSGRGQDEDVPPHEKFDEKGGGVIEDPYGEHTTINLRWRSLTRRGNRRTDEIRGGEERKTMTVV